MAVEDQGTLSESVRVSDSTKDELAGKIQADFNSVMESDEPETETEESSETSPAETADESASTEEAEKTDETEQTDTDTEEAAAPAPAGKAPTLPAAYVRSLKALEWTDDEIAEAAKNPSFITTAAKLHDTRNREIQRWAEIGRQQQKKAQESQPAQQAVAPTVLSPLDVKALKDKYGDEPLIDAIAATVNPTIDRINAILPVIQQTQARAQQAQSESLAREISGFFGGKELEPYKDTYGSDAAKLSPEQIGSRQKVLEFADALMGGAMQQGRQLTVGEALQLAHDAVSGGTKEATARKQITSQLKARQKGITLKPGARGSNLNQSPAKGRSDLEKRVSQGLASMFG